MMIETTLDDRGSDVSQTSDITKFLTMLVDENRSQAGGGRSGGLKGYAAVEWRPF